MSYDCIVVGGGVMGCATAYELAKRGHTTLLLEQFALGHRRGSSHGQSRIIRYSYETPAYVRLMKLAYLAWDDLERAAETALITRTGGLDMGYADTADLLACRASLAAEGLPHEWLDGDEIVARFPQIRPAEGVLGLYQPDAGILPASRCVATLAEEARRHGATIREGAAVARVAPDGGGVRVELAGGEALLAGRAVVTAGPWARGLLAGLGLALPLTVTREQVAFFAPRDPAAFTVGRFPIFIDYGPPADLGAVPFYGFPVFDEPAVKVARHGAGPAVEPDAEQAPPDAAESALLRAYLERVMPEAAGPLTLAETCRYTSTPDHDFIIDRHPAHPQIVIGSPCSGHGFKLAALVGRMLADLAERGATPHPTELFQLARFGQGPA